MSIFAIKIRIANIFLDVSFLLLLSIMKKVALHEGRCLNRM